MNRDAILTWAKDRMALADDGLRGTGFRYFHGLRVAALALALAERMGSAVERDILEVGGVLHDLGKSGGQANEDHGPRGAAILRREAGHLFTPAELERVALIVAQHYARPQSKWYDGQERPVWPDEVLLVQDADLLDHCGGAEIRDICRRELQENLAPEQVLALMQAPAEAQDWRPEVRRALNFEVSRLEFDYRTQQADLYRMQFARELEGKLARPLL